MVVFHALHANSMNQKKGTQMKCESCKNREFVEDGTCYCRYLGTEIDNDAAIIECDGYNSHEREVKE